MSAPTTLPQWYARRYRKQRRFAYALLWAKVACYAFLGLVGAHGVTGGLGIYHLALGLVTAIFLVVLSEAQTTAWRNVRAARHMMLMHPDTTGEPRA